METKKRVVRFGTIFLLNLGVKMAIDGPLSTELMINLGYLISLMLSILIYVIIGIVSVKIYDRHGDNSLGLEFIKESLSKEEEVQITNPLIKFIVNIRKKSGNFILGILLSAKNPGLFVVLYRKVPCLYDGFPEVKIKWCFFRNIILVETYWNTIVYFGVSEWEILEKVLYFFVVTKIITAPLF